MEIKKELIRLYQNGVNIRLENNQLLYKSRKGKLRQEELTFLKENRDKIIKLFKSNSRFEAYQESNRFPLKDIQSAYMLGEKSDYGGVSSHVYFEVFFPKLDEVKVNLIWNKLISKHEALRTVIDSWDTQKILDSDLEYKVLVNEGEEGCNETRDKLMNKYYFPTVWPLFDIELTQFSEQSLIHLSFDFLILDWTSIWVLLKEFEDEYFQGEMYTEIQEFSSLRDIYQNSELKKASSKYLNDQAYWMDKIESLGNYPKLPIKMKDIKNEFTRKSFLLDKNSWAGIKEVSKKYGLTNNTIALTAFACVVKKWIKQQKFVLNLTTMNRDTNIEGIQNIVGDFTSTNLLSVGLDENLSFINNAKNLQQDLLQNLQHNYFSGVQTIREIRKFAPNSIFPIVFTSSLGTHDMNYDYMKLGDVGISQSPQVFMDCQIMEVNGKLYVNIDTRKNIFDEAFIEAFTDDYNQFLLDIITIKNDFEPTLTRWYSKERDKNNFNEIIENINENHEQIVRNNQVSQKNMLSENLIQTVTSQCKKLLQVDKLEPNDNFYEYGADSLVLARLSTSIINICKEYGLNDINFDGLLRALLAEPTISKIIQEINNKVANKKMVNNQEDDSIGKLTIFKKEGQVLKVFFHAGLGTMNCLRYLINELKNNDDDAIAGVTIQNQERYCQLDKSQLVKTISEEYAEHIANSGYEAVHLVGYCSGGLIAIEVANILMFSDIDVNHVTLIDTSPSPLSKIDNMISEMAFIQNHFITIKDVLPNIDYKKLNDSIRVMYSNVKCDSQCNLMDFIIERYGEDDDLKIELEHFFEKYTFNERFEKYAEVIDSKKTADAKVNKGFLIASYKTQMASWEGAHMTPTTYIGDVTYLKAQDKGGFDLLPAQDSNEFWENCCIGDFTVRRIHGNHYDCVENRENASYVAKLLL